VLMCRNLKMTPISMLRPFPYSATVSNMMLL